MTALLLALLLLGALALAVRPGLWPIAIPATLTYPILHGFAVVFAFTVWPDLPTVWNAEHFWGQSDILGIPRGELAWAAVFGFAWPLVVVTLLDARRASD